jgi:hypothetical protein
MVDRCFFNTNNLSKKNVTARITSLDPLAEIMIFSYGGNNYVSVESTTLTDAQINTALTSNTTAELSAQVVFQRDILMRMNVAIPTVLLYLTETAAINGGAMTAAQRTVPAATALQYAIYFRALYRILIDNPDPGTVTWPTPPPALIQGVTHI